MVVNIAPVDYERYLALTGIASVAVPPFGDATPPKREVDEPDAISEKFRQPPVYENKRRREPETHPISTRWRKSQPPADNAVHQQPPPDLRGVFRLQEELGEQTPLQLGVLPERAAVVYGPHPEPPTVNIELTA